MSSTKVERVKQDIALINTRLSEGATQTDLAKEYRVSQKTISVLVQKYRREQKLPVRQYRKPRQGKKTSRKRPLKLAGFIPNIAKSIASGRRCSDIAESMGIDYHILRADLQRYYQKCLNESEELRALRDRVEQQINDGDVLHDIAKREGITENRIKQLFPNTWLDLIRPYYRKLLHRINQMVVTRNITFKQATYELSVDYALVLSWRQKLDLAEPRKNRWNKNRSNILNHSDAALRDIRKGITCAEVSRKYGLSTSFVLRLAKNDRKAR